MGKALNAAGQVIEFPDPTPEERAAASARKVSRDAGKPKPPVHGLDFLKRLQSVEYAAILTASQTQLAAGNPQLALWIDMLRVNGEIDVKSSDAIAAKAMLVAAGLLTQQRADLVFAA